MKAVALSVFFFVAALLRGAEHTLGPITLDLPEDVHVEASSDVLLAFIGGESGDPQAHFNIQIAELAKLRSGEISVPDGFGDLERVLRKKKKSSAVSPHGHPTKRIEGRVSVDGGESFAYAVIFTGKTHLLYFSLVDQRGQEEARALFDQIFAQIDGSQI